MLRNPLPSSRPPRPAGCVAAVALLLAGCAVPEPGAEFNDPYETQNRAVHEAMLLLDDERIIADTGEMPVIR